MYTQLRIANFKGFSGEHNLEMAPITLVYGANSAGKSAVLEALLLLSQSIRPARHSDGAMEPLIFSGENVDLGGFQATINDHNLSRTLELGLTYEVYASEEIFHEMFDVSINWDHQTKRSVLQDCTYQIDIVPDNTVTFKRNRSNLENSSVSVVLDDGLRNVASIVANTVSNKFPNHEESESEKESVSESVVLEIMTTSEYQNWSFLPGIKFIESRMDEMNRLVNAGDMTKEDLLEVFTRELIHRDWRNMLEDRFNNSRRRLSSIRYIGPLRKSPTRFEPLVEHQPTYVGNNGQNIGSILFKDRSALLKVNSYLTKMSIPYEVDVKRLDSDASGTLGEIISIQLVDKRSNVILSLEDVGFGISQVLPLLVQLAISKKHLVIVEQPELHLHPALQANFGDLLVEGIKNDSKSQFLIETHSEHLILRLQRRIRSGELPAEALAVYYVDATPQNGSQIKRLELDEKGDFITPWPNGFFPERLDELLA